MNRNDTRRANIQYIPQSVITYRGLMGLSWLAWAGHDEYYEEVWYVQRFDSVTPSAPRAVSHDDLLDEIGAEYAILSAGIIDG